MTVAALALFTWPVASLTPTAGLDNSWAVGLSLALARGIVFGRQVVFTFGPLGLVTAPRAVTSGTLLLGLLGAAAIQLALVAVVLHTLRRRLPWPIAVLITLCGVSIIVAAGVPPLDEIAFGAVAITLGAATCAGAAGGADTRPRRRRVGRACAARQTQRRHRRHGDRRRRLAGVASNDAATSGSARLRSCSPRRSRGWRWDSR